MFNLFDFWYYGMSSNIYESIYISRLYISKYIIMNKYIYFKVYKIFRYKRFIVPCGTFIIKIKKLYK